MTQEQAIKLVQCQIKSGTIHQDYVRCCELAETYRIYITGLEMWKKLIQYVPREDKDMFAQRCRLTKAITPAIHSIIKQPFNRVARTDRIKKSVEVGNDARNKVIEDMIKKFYGSAQKKDRGLDYWCKTRFPELSFIDPNSWLVIEWDAPGDEATPITPRPFEVCTEWATNYFAVNDDVKWLFVKQPITYQSYGQQSPAVGGVQPVPGSPGAPLPQMQYGTSTLVPTFEEITARKPNPYNGYRYTLYDEDYTVMYEQVDLEYLKTSGYQLDAGETLLTLDSQSFIVRISQPKVGYPTTFRIGYRRDDATNGRTFVNPWHDALCFFDKSVKTVSELDLTMTLHSFPQKLQYVQQCVGGDTKATRCNKGKLVDGSICQICKGSGYKLHTTAQDAILLPMPDSKEDIMDLNGLLVYKSPPIDLVKFQNDYAQQQGDQARDAVFNSQAFVKSTATGVKGTNSTQTATEVNTNMESVYNTLEPFTEKFSELWRGTVTTFAILAGALIDDIKVAHDFPADYKLKTIEMLLSERFTAAEAGAPGFLIATIDDDMANIVYAGDEQGMATYQTKRRYFPFVGNTTDEITMLMTSQYVLKEPKVLYSNFDLIFKELATENKDFYTMTDMDAQRALVDAKVAQYLEKIAAQAPVVTINTLRGGNPAAAANNGGGGNPGGGGAPTGAAVPPIDKTPNGIARPFAPGAPPVKVQ